MSVTFYAQTEKGRSTGPNYANGNAAALLEAMGLDALPCGDARVEQIISGALRVSNSLKACAPHVRECYSDGRVHRGGLDVAGIQRRAAELLQWAVDVSQAGGREVWWG